MHAEVVKPAIQLLNNPEYAGAREEFLRAHEHYRKGNAERGYNRVREGFGKYAKNHLRQAAFAYDPTATAKTLIDICFDKGLIPSYWQSHFSSLQSLLVSGVPTGRNKISAHGQGSNAN